MNRLFVIRVGEMEVKGLVSPGELPDIIYQFSSLCKKRGATFLLLSTCTLQATRGKVTLRLTIEGCSNSIPSKTLEETLFEVMDQTFP